MNIGGYSSHAEIRRPDKFAKCNMPLYMVHDHVPSSWQHTVHDAAH